MTRSQPARHRVETSIRQDEKQSRAVDGTGTVRVFGPGGYVIVTLNSLRDAEQIRRLLAAPNAVPVWTHGGKLVGIRFLSFGDERGQSGERHGRSTVTTERVRNDAGGLIGGDLNLKHKAENVIHALRPPAWAADAPSRRPIKPPLAMN